MTGDQRHLHILDVLRQRICFAGPTATVSLSEVELAAEFEVSRTPIRQVLQRLAYEKLVVIRSGVGTLAPPLVKEERESHFLILKGITIVAAEVERKEVSTKEKASIRGMRAFVSKGAKLTIDDAAFMCSTILEVLCERCEDVVLQDALRASYWRAVRWIGPVLVSMNDAQRKHVKDLFDDLLLRSEQPEAGLFNGMHNFNLRLFIED